MSMTKQSVVDAARYLLNDYDSARYRVLDAHMIVFLDAAEAEVWNRRTDSHLDSNGALLTRTTITDLSGNMTIPERFKPACVDYLCFRAFQMPASEIANANQAKIHWDSFEKHLTS